jgi:hypothetical protein
MVNRRLNRRVPAITFEPGGEALTISGLLIARMRENGRAA